MSRRRALATRQALFQEVDRQLSQQVGSNAADSMTGFQQRALDLLTSENTQRAFRMSDEPEAVRDAYGRNIYGQSMLLARRLIEAGTRHGHAVVGTRRQRHLGHARRQLQEAEEGRCCRNSTPRAPAC